MSQAPYRDRPSGEPDPRLARLAAEGERRIGAARERGGKPVSAEQAHDMNIRIALGARYGTPVRRLGYALFGVVALALAAGLFGEPWLGIRGEVAVVVIGVAALVGGLVCMSARTVASQTRVAAERAWVAALPFALDGYFDGLAEPPARICMLVLELAWDLEKPGGVPSPETVHGVTGMWDTGARVVAREGGGVTIHSSSFTAGFFSSGLVETVDSWGNVAPNGRFVVELHRAVNQVLLPLHGSHPIARVAVRRVVRG